MPLNEVVLRPQIWSRLKPYYESTITAAKDMLNLGDKIQGPSWGQQKRRTPLLWLQMWHLLDPHSLKTLTSLNKEVGPFFLGDSSIWSLPSVSSLSDYSIWKS